jgi:predicted CXXCH cytochrome family protein
MCHDDHPRPDDTVIHAPVAGGDCGACHTPHASSHDGLLLADARTQCLSCHQDLVAREESARTVHDTDLEGEGCLACHQPHSSTETHLLSAGSIRTCLNCHEMQRHGHPLGADRLDPRTGEPITCVTCHDPHGTEFPMQLRGDQKRGLCLECHGESPDADAAARDSR